MFRKRTLGNKQHGFPFLSPHQQQQGNNLKHRKITHWPCHFLSYRETPGEAALYAQLSDVSTLHFVSYLI